MYLRGENYYIERSVSFLSHLLKWPDSSSLFEAIFFFCWQCCIQLGQMSSTWPAPQITITNRKLHVADDDPLVRLTGGAPPLLLWGYKCCWANSTGITPATHKDTVSGQSCALRNNCCGSLRSTCHIPRACFPLLPGAELQEVSPLPSTMLSFHAGNCWRCTIGHGETYTRAVSTLKLDLPQKSCISILMDLWLLHIMYTYYVYVQWLYNVCNAVDV